MELSAPTDEQLESEAGFAVATRATIHRGHLSLVERLRVRRSGTDTTAVLKTVCPALSHERHVHAAVQDYAICAPVLLAAHDANDDHDAWLLLSDVDEVPFDDLTPDQAAEALVELAAVHRAYLGVPNLAGVPRRDPSWLAEHAEETAERLLHLRRWQGLQVDEELVHGYPCRLRVLAEQHGLQLALVHGDFDPGNLVLLPSGKFAALDWGLGHLNTPLVDFAHMAERFSTTEQSRLASDFADAAGLSGRTSKQLLEIGLLAHRAFFVWWHSLITSEGWAPLEGFQQAITQRVGLIAGHG